MPRPRLGQHFLKDRKVLAAVIRALDLSPGETVVEIGAGQGVLTRELQRSGASIVAIELDDVLAARLGHEFTNDEDVVILHADVLGLDPCDVSLGWVDGNNGRGYKLAGNIPYYITGQILRHYLATPCRPVRAVLMVQLEVARRMMAPPGEMNLLAVATQLFADVSLVTRVDRDAFRPRPKVESAVVLLRTFPAPRVDVSDEQGFFRVVRAGFSTRRKQLANSLALGLGIPKTSAQRALDATGIDARLRAQDLSLESWSKLTGALLPELEPAAPLGS